MLVGGRYSKVLVRVWDDPRVKTLTPIEPSGQGLWIKLLVNKYRINIPGVIRVGEGGAGELREGALGQLAPGAQLQRQPLGRSEGFLGGGGRRLAAAE